ncbi:TetR/AcrR family transcriptional regulator [Paenibacillaceae bacterium]|nr:TetR/AcrR family transcriptional regulator [Paenibacillaceae bacterium]
MGANMRSIAQQAGMTTGAIYRYFSDKNALFEALVSPAIYDFKDWFETFAHRQLEMLDINVALPGFMATEKALLQFVAHIYAHFDVFDLLVNCSAGSSLANYIDSLIEFDISSTQAYLERMEQLGMLQQSSPNRYIPILIKQSYKQILEIVVSRMSHEEAREYMQLLIPFLYAGWSSIMGGKRYE